MINFVFDIDGTLIDSAAADRVCFRRALAEHGYDFTEEELAFAFGMPGRQALPLLGVAEEKRESVMTRWETLLYSRLDETKPYPGVLEILEELRARGKKLGVVTSRTAHQLALGFTPLGLNHYFDAIICADDVENPKPAPDELIECIRRLGGTREQTVLIGDSQYDMQCASSAGVRSALALWGCGEPDKLIADVRLAQPSDILEL